MSAATATSPPSSPVRVDAQLLQDIALDLGDGDAQHHLFLAARDQGVHHLARALQEAAGNVGRERRLQGGGNDAGEHHIGAAVAHGDGGAGQRGAQRLFQPARVAGHAHFDDGGLLALAIADEKVVTPSPTPVTKMRRAVCTTALATFGSAT